MLKEFSPTLAQACRKARTAASRPAWVRSPESGA